MNIQELHQHWNVENVSNLTELQIDRFCRNLENLEIGWYPNPSDRGEVKLNKISITNIIGKITYLFEIDFPNDKSGIAINLYKGKKAIIHMKAIRASFTELEYSEFRQFYGDLIDIIFK